MGTPISPISCASFRPSARVLRRTSLTLNGMTQPPLRAARVHRGMSDPFKILWTKRGTMGAGGNDHATQSVYAVRDRPGSRASILRRPARIQYDGGQEAGRLSLAPRGCATAPGGRDQPRARADV